MSRNSSKRNSTRISRSPSAISPNAPADTHDGVNATDVQTEVENARRRQRRVREHENDDNNLDDSQSSDTPSPPEGGGNLSVVARAGLTSSRQGRQPPATEHGPQTPSEGQVVNHITGWKNYQLTDMSHNTVPSFLSIHREYLAHEFCHPLFPKSCCPASWH